MLTLVTVGNPCDCLTDFVFKCEVCGLHAELCEMADGRWRQQCPVILQRLELLIDGSFPAMSMVKFPLSAGKITMKSSFLGLATA